MKGRAWRISHDYSYLSSTGVVAGAFFSSDLSLFSQTCATRDRTRMTTPLLTYLEVEPHTAAPGYRDVTEPHEKRASPRISPRSTLRGARRRYTRRRSRHLRRHTH